MNDTNSSFVLGVFGYSIWAQDTMVTGRLPAGNMRIHSNDNTQTQEMHKLASHLSIRTAIFVCDTAMRRRS